MERKRNIYKAWPDRLGAETLEAALATQYACLLARGWMLREVCGQRFHRHLSDLSGCLMERTFEQITFPRRSWRARGLLLKESSCS
jgi:hypothetical protein